MHISPSVTCLVLTFLVGTASAEAQLFKGAAQRRETRQSSGGSMQGTSQRNGLFGGRQSGPNSQYQSNQYQNSRPTNRYDVGGSREKTGLFGRPKESNGGLFNRRANEESTSRSYEDKKSGGLFSRARERREEQYYSNQQQQYVKPQRQATASYTPRTQKATSAGSLFADFNNSQQSASVSNPKAPAGNTASRPSGSPISSLATPTANSDSRQDTARLVNAQPQESKLPSIVNVSGSSKSPAATAKRVVRPQVPERSRKPPAFATPAAPLHDTGDDLPAVSPTGTPPNLHAPMLAVTSAVLA